MLIVALDCFAKGAGAPQNILSEDLTWVWYVVGLLWVGNAVNFYNNY